MFAVGEIVEIFAPTVGYVKYHLCIAAGEGGAHQFLFLNSDPGFDGTYVVDCARVPCLPASPTGKTAFSLNMVPRYNDKQLQLYKGRKLGILDKGLAAELLAFASDIANSKGLTRGERETVCGALQDFIK